MSVDRAGIARVAAPVAFLLAVTIAVLLIRPGLREDATVPATPPVTLPTGTVTVAVRSGDTLEGIAARTGTTVDVLERLNPGVERDVLRVGRRIRVR